MVGFSIVIGPHCCIHHASIGVSLSIQILSTFPLPPPVPALPGGICPSSCKVIGTTATSPREGRLIKPLPVKIRAFSGRSTTSHCRTGRAGSMGLYKIWGWTRKGTGSPSLEFGNVPVSHAGGGPVGCSKTAGTVGITGVGSTGVGQRGT